MYDDVTGFYGIHDVYVQVEGMNPKQKKQNNNNDFMEEPTFVA